MLPSIRYATTPRIFRVSARVILVAMFVLPIGLAFIPWQQTVLGTGRAVAFNPVERPQPIVAPIQGRINKWHVVEGQHVKAGTLLVEMLDVDPLLPQRLEDEAQAVSRQMTQALGAVQEVQSRITDLKRSQDQRLAIQRNTISAQERDVDSTEQEIYASEETLELATKLFERLDRLTTKSEVDIVTRQRRDDAKTAYERAKYALIASENRWEAANERLIAAQELTEQILNDTNAQLAGERQNLANANAAVDNVRRQQLSVDNRIARQRQQNIYAPTNGTIFRLLANGEAGGQLVNPGQQLSTLVPDIRSTPDRNRLTSIQLASTLGLISSNVVSPATGTSQIICAMTPQEALAALTYTDYPGIVCELLIDGNDLPLVRIGDKVRLQFEGWPAVQFVAYPEAAAGTFGGLVYLVDPTANDNGMFRILVEPDPADTAWPEQDLLRQGVRAQGWVLLEQVTLGWELWRLLNGFPPIREVKSKQNSGFLGPVQRK